MIANDLISSSLLTIDYNENGDSALKLMDEFRVYHLAVTNKKKYLGVISENEILNWDKSSENINSHTDKLIQSSVRFSQHLFDIIQEVEKYSLSIIPVLNEKNDYLGAITNRRLLYTIAKSTAIQSIGGVIVLKIKHNDYHMSEIARIIESNNAKILSSYITSESEMEYIEVTIKLNKVNITSIVKDFERFDYIITASYNKVDQTIDLTDRYESLMRFLNP